jgi:Dna[CI] antecedent, DciA
MTFRRLRSALEIWTPTGEAPEPILALRAAWPEIVGDEIAKHSRPHELERNALLVVTRSGAWSQQLAFLSERILANVRQRTGQPVEKIRFRVGRLISERAAAPGKRSTRVKRVVDHRTPVATAGEALARFRDDVMRAQRAKAAAGWKECLQCGVRIAPAAGRFCAPCSNAWTQGRSEQVARLLFDVPWLGFAGASAMVEGLTQYEYEGIRRKLLGTWWETLQRIRREGRRRLTTRERLIASSYVLLKSGLDPERIAPAVVRDVLGDELHHLIYGNEN